MKQFDKWHKTKPGFLVFALVELAVAYGLSSLAIDKGNVLYYLLTLIFLVGALRNFVKLIGSLIHGTKTAKRR